MRKSRFGAEPAGCSLGTHPSARRRRPRSHLGQAHRGRSGSPSRSEPIEPHHKPPGNQLKRNGFERSVHQFSPAPLHGDRNGPTHSPLTSQRPRIRSTKGRFSRKRLQAGCCWEMQCRVPSPQTSSRQSIGMISRPGKQADRISAASASFLGCRNAGISTAPLITRKFA